MSGIAENSHNKFVTCEGCPTRRPDPNCHLTCKGYLFRQERNRKIKENKKADLDYVSFKCDTVARTKKAIGK